MIIFAANRQQNIIITHGSPTNQPTDPPPGETTTTLLTTTVDRTRSDSWPDLEWKERSRRRDAFQVPGPRSRTPNGPRVSFRTGPIDRSDSDGPIGMAEGGWPIRRLDFFCWGKRDVNCDCVFGGLKDEACVFLLQVVRVGIRQDNLSYKNCNCKYTHLDPALPVPNGWVSGCRLTTPQS